MTIVRVGATKKYTDGWASAFGKGKKKPEGTATPGKAKPSKAGKKKAVKTSAKKKASAPKSKKRKK